MRVLITAAATAQAHKLKRILDKGETFIFADDVELGGFTSVGSQFLRIPSAGSSSFAHELLTVCLDQDINIVYPLRRKEIIALAEARQLFEEYNIIIMVPSKDVVELLLLKTIKKGTLLALNKGESLPLETIHLKTPLDRGVLIVNTEDQTDFSLFTAD